MRGTSSFMGSMLFVPHGSSVELRRLRLIKNSFPSVWCSLSRNTQYPYSSDVLCKADPLCACISLCLCLSAALFLVYLGTNRPFQFFSWFSRFGVRGLSLFFLTCRLSLSSCPSFAEWTRGKRPLAVAGLWI